MDNNDPTNVEYSNIISTIGSDELAAIQMRAYEAQVQAAARVLSEYADALAEHFDMFVVAAALETVWNDYDEATGAVDQ